MICTCLYLRKKVSSNDALDGMKMTRLVRRNSYDEAIGEFFTAQRKDSFSSNSSKGNGSPKLVHMKRSRSGSISKKLLQFGRDGSKKRTNKDPREYQKPEEAEESATEEKQPDIEKDDGYTVKRGTTSQQNKFLQKLTVDSPDSFERRNTTSSSMKIRRSRAPSSMSQYSRRFDNMSNCRSSSRMHQSSCLITGTHIQLVTD